jgi:hypothetical protein
VLIPVIYSPFFFTFYFTTMKNIFRKLPIILSLVAILASSSFVFAQDNGMDKDKGKHTGQMKRHRNRGLHRGQIKHPVKTVSPRANRRATTPKPAPAPKPKY